MLSGISTNEISPIKKYLWLQLSPKLTLSTFYSLQTIAVTNTHSHLHKHTYTHPSIYFHPAVGSTKSVRQSTKFSLQGSDFFDKNMSAVIVWQL